MREEKLFEKKINLRDLALGMMAYTGTSIIGPLLFFGLIGFFIDKFFNTKPLFLIIGIIIAFIFTNILIFKKVNKLNKSFNKIQQEKRQVEKTKKQQ